MLALSSIDGEWIEFVAESKKIVQRLRETISAVALAVSKPSSTCRPAFYIYRITKPSKCSCPREGTSIGIHQWSFGGK